MDDIRVIDTDTHLVEPPDLWTTRMPSKWQDMVPHVRWDEENQEEAWFIGAERVTSVAGAAQAGWREFPPDHPPRWEDADPATWEPKARLARMDEYGIHAQVLYPNVAMFNSDTVQGAVRDAGFQLCMIQAYNDYQTEFSATAPGRFVPVTSLPFWDLQATLDEIERCAAMGHRGIVFSQAPSAFGLPELTDRFWDPMWRSAEEKGLPVNFHIASGDMGIMHNAGHPDNGEHANYASMGVQFFMGNARTVAQLICGGICHRFPELNFV
ncbi:MAG TPA: amidohydrolase family protein, partial [Acidimicrobiales bacterium]